ncbi:hypothetical protein JX265_003675 [Neoarthrinium moseri]|uniref:Uncharacterized protein n=1 Tax=Neoarthrinium moseri TaxID=1658444 RepID=A0A9Q0APG7_9PEZI|nr:hypothetical protein JX265_003675 [Neoarthrinium moseri]
MADLNPTAPSQPTTDAAYKSADNPATSTPSEQRASRQKSDAPTVEERKPTSAASAGQDATASSLGRGVHGGGPGEETQGRTQGQLDRRELEGEQVRPPGEGDVAGAVERKSGAGGAQPDFAGDLHR